MHIKSLLVTPPGGWVFTDQTTGFTMSANVFQDLVREVAIHRANNGIPLGTVAEDIAVAICTRISPRDRAEWCTENRQRKTSNPGDLFSLIIEKITGRNSRSCGLCATRANNMNQWGWWGSWRNRKIIVGWLVEEAAKRGHPIGENEVLSLLKASIKELQRRNP